MRNTLLAVSMLVLAGSSVRAQPRVTRLQGGGIEIRFNGRMYTQIIARWVVPLKPGFRQENFLGMNATDYGGGTPVVDVWRRDAGLAVGH
jgi:hypothetical protein